MKKLIAALCLLAVSSGTAWATSHPESPAMAPKAAASAASASAESMTEGEVRKIDKENKKITLKHGEIKNLGMPGMTMVFQMSDAAMADKLKAGDKVRFTADKQGSAFVVTRIDKP